MGDSKSTAAGRQRRFPLPSLRLIVGIVAGAFAVMLVLQAITIAALMAVDKQRKRRSAPAAFPHSELPEVSLDGSSFQIYVYGRDLFDAMLAAIDEATDSIYMETFIWKDDEAGQEFKEHLARKAEQGVAVYAIYDVFGNLVVPREFKQFPANIHLLRYRAIHRLRHLLMARRYALDHRKLLIVDGKVAFIGGYNIGSLYATEWLDTHLRITGPDATFIAQAFVDFWNRNAPRSDLIDKRYRRHYNAAMGVRSNDAMRLTFPIRDMYLNGIDAADHNIRLTSAYFIPDHVLLNSLKAAAARGVDVQVLVPWTSNHIIADWASHAYFTECLQAGIRIFGYEHAMIHAKTCTVDGELTTIGTANIDRLSSVGNYEINAVIINPDVAKQMERIFEADKSNAFELKLEQWSLRPWYVKVSEQIIKPLRVVL